MSETEDDVRSRRVAERRDQLELERLQGEANERERRRSFEFSLEQMVKTFSIAVCLFLTGACSIYAIILLAISVAQISAKVPDPKFYWWPATGLIVTTAVLLRFTIGLVRMTSEDAMKSSAPSFGWFSGIIAWVRSALGF